jgi:hypothetical protein
MTMEHLTDHPPESTPGSVLRDPSLSSGRDALRSCRTHGILTLSATLFLQRAPLSIPLPSCAWRTTPPGRSNKNRSPPARISGDVATARVCTALKAAPAGEVSYSAGGGPGSRSEAVPREWR